MRFVALKDMDGKVLWVNEERINIFAENIGGKGVLVNIEGMKDLFLADGTVQELFQTLANVSPYDNWEGCPLCGSKEYWVKETKKNDQDSL